MLPSWRAWAAPCATLAVVLGVIAFAAQRAGHAGAAYRPRADEEVLKAILAEPDDDPNDLAALDAAWQDEEVTFGPGAASACGTGGIAAKIRAARRPAPDLPQPAPQRPVVTVSKKTPARPSV